MWNKKCNKVINVKKKKKAKQTHRYREQTSGPSGEREGGQ